MREKIESWYKSLPEYERDLPLIEFKGEKLSPREILEKLTPELQSRLEAHILSARQNSLKELAKERLLKMIKERPVEMRAWGLEKAKYTPEEIEEMIKEQSGIAPSLIDTEEERMADLIGRI